MPTKKIKTRPSKLSNPTNTEQEKPMGFYSSFDKEVLKMVDDMFVETLHNEMKQVIEKPKSKQKVKAQEIELSLYEKFKRATYQDENSPVLGFKVVADNSSFPKTDKSPIKLYVSYPSGYVKDAFTVDIPSPYRILHGKALETRILHVLTRTKYNGKFKLDFTRYSVDLAEFNNDLIRKLLDYIILSENPRINYTWVKPLQDLLIKRELRSKLNRKNSKELYGVDVGQPFDAPDPIDEDEAEHENEDEIALNKKQKPSKRRMPFTEFTTAIGYLTAEISQSGHAHQFSQTNFVSPDIGHAIRQLSDDAGVPVSLVIDSILNRLHPKKSAPTPNTIKGGGRDLWRKTAVTIIGSTSGSTAAPITPTTGGLIQAISAQQLQGATSQSTEYDWITLNHTKM